MLMTLKLMGFITILPILQILKSKLHTKDQVTLIMIMNIQAK